MNRFVDPRKNIAKNTFIVLGDFFDHFVNDQVQSARFTSASEVARAALRMLEYEENKKVKLVTELEKGEQSDLIKDFSRENFLKTIHQKHVTNEEAQNQ